MMEPSERFWENLLLFIDEGKVIPVVGQELVSIAQGDQQVPLYGWLAQRLADEIDLPVAGLPGPLDINTVVAQSI
jgi:hypothetical protein